MAHAEETLSFEAALQRWEEVVEQLEQGTLTLEESLRLYEEGIRLRDICHTRLTEAEGKMKILRQTPDGKVLEEEQ